MDIKMIRNNQRIKRSIKMKKVRRLLWVALLVFSSSKFSFPQETLILTLEESIRLALAQNPSYLASEEKVETARAQVREAAASFFPSLNAQGLRRIDEKLPVLQFPSFFPGQPPQRISVDFTKCYQLSLFLTLPIFTSGRLTSGFKQANYNLLSTEEGVRQSKQTMVFNTKQAFYSCLLAKDFVKVAEEAVEVAEKHYENVKSLYEVGMASKFDLLRSEVQVANLKPQLIRSRNSLKIAELALKTLLGLDLSRPVEIKGELTFEPYEPDLEKSIAKALSARPEISQVRYQKEMADQMLKMARASSLPIVALSATYNFWSNNFDFRRDNWENYYIVNLVFSIPIFNGFANSAKVAQSRAMIKEIDLADKGLQDMIKFEVRQAILKLKEAHESLLSQEKNVEQAQESLRIAELNFSEGMATTLDVSSAQAALSQAKTNYSQALYDYVISRAELEKAIGVDLEGPNTERKKE
jgi:outer membrane protein